MIDSDNKVIITREAVYTKDPELRKYVFEQIFLSDEEMNKYKYAYQKCCFEDKIKIERHQAKVELASAIFKSGIVAVGALAGWITGNVIGGPVLGTGTAALMAVSMAKLTGTTDNLSEMLGCLKEAKQQENNYQNFLNKYRGYEKGRIN